VNAKTQYIHLKCPKPLLDDFDSCIKGKYGTRSAAIFEAMRLLISREAKRDE